MICTFEKMIFEQAVTGYCVAAFKTDDVSVPTDARSKERIVTEKFDSLQLATEFPQQMPLILNWRANGKKPNMVYSLL